MFIMSKVSYRQHLLIALIVCVTDYSDIKISRNYVVNYVVMLSDILSIIIFIERTNDIDDVHIGVIFCSLTKQW